MTPGRGESHRAQMGGECVSSFAPPHGAFLCEAAARAQKAPLLKNTKRIYGAVEAGLSCVLLEGALAGSCGLLTR